MRWMPKHRGARFGLGVFASYVSFEAYMHFQTQRIISARNAHVQDTTDSPVPLRYRSAVVNGMFVNPFEEYRPQTGFEFLWVRLMEVFEGLYGQVEVHERYKTPLGELKRVDELLRVFRPDYDSMRHHSRVWHEPVTGEAWRAVRNTMLFTWLGQSCSLVQVGGINILTDPIFSNHLISRHMGPQRLVKSPMTVEDVHTATNGHLDLVMVSHNHPDHLELDCVRQLGNSATWIVPLGLKKVLAREGVYNVVEMDWWDTVPLNPYLSDHPDSMVDRYDVVCVPAMHWSGRHVVDSNTSLWGSFILRRNGKSIFYHAGDTGYSEGLFQAIALRYGPVTLSMLPIGQYCPEWHQRPRHILPAESIKIASALLSKYVFGVHFGTFKLSAEPLLEPKDRLEALARSMGKPDTYRAPEFGQTYTFALDDE